MMVESSKSLSSGSSQKMGEGVRREREFVGRERVRKEREFVGREGVRREREFGGGWRRQECGLMWGRDEGGGCGKR